MQSVRRWMSSPAIVVTAATPLPQARRQMQEQRIRRDTRADVWFRRGPVKPLEMIGDPIGFFALHDADAAEDALWRLRASRNARPVVPPPRPWNPRA